MAIKNVKPGARLRNHGQVAEMAAYGQHSDMLQQPCVQSFLSAVDFTATQYMVGDAHD